MKRFFLPAYALLIISMAASGCEPGRSLGSTELPLPTNTSIPTSTPLPISTPTITSTPSQTPTHTPAPPVFLGKIIVMEENDLLELAASKDHPKVTSNLIATAVTSAVISPDFSHIVHHTYTTDRSGNAIHLYDLNTRTDAVILPYMADDFAWSPDGPAA
jgi:hypothetical protein